MWNDVKCNVATEILYVDSNFIDFFPWPQFQFKIKRNWAGEWPLTKQMNQYTDASQCLNIDLHNEQRFSYVIEFIMLMQLLHYHKPLLLNRHKIHSQYLSKWCFRRNHFAGRSWNPDECGQMNHTNPHEKWPSLNKTKQTNMCRWHGIYGVN